MSGAVRSSSRHHLSHVWWSFLVVPVVVLGGQVVSHDPASAAPGDVTITATSDTHLRSTSSPGTGERGVAALVSATPSDAVLMPGDLTNTGSASDFAMFDTLYSPVKSRMRPAPGNHDFSGTDASAYFNYFGPTVGSVSTPWYSFDLGAWHVVSLAAGPDPGMPDYWSASSPQINWLTTDLNAHPAQPTLVEFHQPRFSGATHGDSTDLMAIWNVLYAHHVELVLNGHDHTYQRFAPQNPSGQAVTDGIREIIVSTGGSSHNAMSNYTSGHNLEAWNSTNFGVTTMTLGATSYSWKFTASDGSSWTDSGTSAVNPQHQSSTGNRPPVANAGPDQTVPAGTSGTAQVTLDGSASTDPDGDSLTYRWAEGSTTVATTATASMTLAVGVHTLVLTVTDPGGLAGTDTVVIAVQGSAHVSGLVDSSRVINRNRWQPTVTVTVVNEKGEPLAGASVTFRVTGLVTQTSSCTTGTSGTCQASASTVKRGGSVTFTVTGVAAPARIYQARDDVVGSLTVTR